jgi:hypothetical protein
MLGVGLIVGAAIVPGPLAIGGVRLDVDTLAAASALMTIGLQAILFAIFTVVYASNEGFLPPSGAIGRLRRIWTLERGLAVGAVLGLAGIAGGVASLTFWYGYTFGRLPYDTVLRLVLPSTTALVMSCQIIFGTFFLSILDVRHSDRRLSVDAVQQRNTRSTLAAEREGHPESYQAVGSSPAVRQADVPDARPSHGGQLPAEELPGSVRDRRRGRHRSR